MTLHERTARKYRGEYAANYEAKRRKQIRWRIENETVERMMADATGSVLDVPVGSGRFLRLWRRLNLTPMGIDCSSDMLTLARKKRIEATLLMGDARELPLMDQQMDSVVCVRFLDLIGEEAMRRVAREIFRVSRSRVILTIRLGSQYVLKSNTATHDEKKFRALVRREEFEILEEVPVFKQGWVVMRLQRRETPR